MERKQKRIRNGICMKKVTDWVEEAKNNIQVNREVEEARRAGMIKIMKLMKKYVGIWLVLKTSQVIEVAEMEEVALVVVMVQMIEAAKKTAIVILFQKLQYPAVLGNEKEIHLLKKIYHLQSQLKSM